MGAGPIMYGALYQVGFHDRMTPARIAVKTMKAPVEPRMTPMAQP